LNLDAPMIAAETCSLLALLVFALGKLEYRFHISQI